MRGLVVVGVVAEVLVRVAVAHLVVEAREITARGGVTVRNIIVEVLAAWCIALRIAWNLKDRFFVVHALGRVLDIRVRVAGPVVVLRRIQVVMRIARVTPAAVAPGRVGEVLAASRLVCGVAEVAADAVGEILG